MSSALFNRLQRWAPLSAQDASLLESTLRRTSIVERGDHPLARIDAHAYSLVMLEGWAADYKDTRCGKRVIVEFLLPGELRLATPHRDSNLNTVMMSRGSVALVSNEALARLRESDAIHAALDWISKIRESVMAEWLVNIASRKACARLAHLLCELHARMNSADLVKQDACDLPLTQVDLANALSMTNVHLNLALRRLRLAKLVDLSDRKLRIRDQHKLEAMAGFDDEYLLRWPTELPNRRYQPQGSRVPTERRRLAWQR